MGTVRNLVFANNQYYHIFNRGVERKTIFSNGREFTRALKVFKYYQYDGLPIKFSKFLTLSEEKQAEILLKNKIPENKLVDIIAFCLMPNHFHFLLKQQKDNGILKFISNFTNSHTKYFNTKHERNGPLIQGPFKAVLVESDEQLIHLSRYIHLNPVASFTIKDSELKNYEWSSLKEYLGLEDGICQKEIVLGQFKSMDDYKNFVFDQITYLKELDKIKHLTLE